MNKSFEEYLKKNLTEEEIAEIKANAMQEADQIRKKKQLEHKKYCSPDCPEQKAQPSVKEK